jgi:hypothetical protein
MERGVYHKQGEGDCLHNFGRTTEEMRRLGKPGHYLQDGNKMVVEEIGWRDMN